MTKQFDVIENSLPIADFPLAGNQGMRARETASVRAFKWRDIRGNTRNLPKYVLAEITAAGFEPHYLGGTTYSHSVIGLSSVDSHD